MKLRPGKGGAHLALGQGCLPSSHAATPTSSAWVQTLDTEEKKFIAKEIVAMLPYVSKELTNSNKGVAESDPIILPRQVTGEILTMIIAYGEFHRAPGRSDKERKIFDERFVRIDTKRLCELTSAADALEMRSLVDMASRALARLIEGKSPDEIREAFNLPDDLSEEEKLEPVRNLLDDPRIRLLNRLYAKKRKELAYRTRDKAAGRPPSSGRQGGQDERSLEELLSFIEDAAPGAGSTNGSSHNNSHSTTNNTANSTSSHNLSAPSISNNNNSSTAKGKASKKKKKKNKAEDEDTSDRKIRELRIDAPAEELFPEEGFDDSDIDEATREEVQSFAARLTASWSPDLPDILATSSTPPRLRHRAARLPGLPALEPESEEGPRPAGTLHDAAASSSSSDSSDGSQGMDSDTETLPSTSTPRAHLDVSDLSGSKAFDQDPGGSQPGTSLSSGLPSTTAPPLLGSSGNNNLSRGGLLGPPNDSIRESLEHMLLLMTTGVTNTKVAKSPTSTSQLAAASQTAVTKGTAKSKKGAKTAGALKSPAESSENKPPLPKTPTRPTTAGNEEIEAVAAALSAFIHAAKLDGHLAVVRNRGSMLRPPPATVPSTLVSPGTLDMRAMPAVSMQKTLPSGCKLLIQLQKG